MAIELATVPQIYEKTKTLPPTEQMRLAAMILADLSPSLVDESEEWSEEDLRDWSRSGMMYVNSALGEDVDA